MSYLLGHNSKKQIIELAEKQAGAAIERAEADITKLFVEATRQAQFNSTLADTYRPAVIDCIGFTSQTIDNAKIEPMETAVKYDYSGCPVWQGLFEQECALANRRKNREAMLKTIKARIIEIDSDTGEVMEILPPKRTSTSTIKITY